MDLIDSAGTGKTFPAELKFGSPELRQCIHRIMGHVRRKLRGEAKAVPTPKKHKIRARNVFIPRVRYHPPVKPKFQRKPLPEPISVNRGDTKKSCLDPEMFHGPGAGPRRYR